MWSAIKRGPSTCRTFQSFKLTYLHVLRSQRCDIDYYDSSSLVHSINLYTFNLFSITLQSCQTTHLTGINQNSRPKTLTLSNKRTEDRTRHAICPVRFIRDEYANPSCVYQCTTQLCMTPDLLSPHPTCVHLMIQAKDVICSFL